MKEYDINSFINVLAVSNLDTLRQLVYDISTRTASMRIWDYSEEVYMSFYGSSYFINRDLFYSSNYRRVCF